MIRNYNTDASDLGALRRCLGHFVTGVTVVTTLDDTGAPRGLTANSFTSVSLNPPLVLVCIANAAASFDAFKTCENFTINILSDEQRFVSQLFATGGRDKFAEVEWSYGANGAPRLANSLAVIQCHVHERQTAGDHLILLGRVLSFESAPRRPLIYGMGNYISLHAQDVIVEESRNRDFSVVCIADAGGKIVLVRDRNQDIWSLPGTFLGKARNRGPGFLQQAFREIDLSVEVTFLYSVFETQDPPQLNLVYRGTLMSPIKETGDLRLFSEDQMPWGRLAAAADEPMLRRYFRERSFDQFGVYAQIHGSGQVATIQGTPTQFDSYFTQFR